MVTITTSPLFFVTGVPTATRAKLAPPLKRVRDRNHVHNKVSQASTFSSVKDHRKPLGCLTIQNSYKDAAISKSNSGMTSQLELKGSESAHKPVHSIYWLLLLNLGIYVADHLLKLNALKALYLYHSWPKWYQFFTAMFCHVNWNHLSSNLFFLYIFGKLVEEEGGGLALWMSYLVTGAGANLLSWLILPRTVVSIGASGAVFGLFAISVLLKMSWNWRKILEVFILGQFVLEKVMEAGQASVQMAGSTYGKSLSNVNHIAHLSGALVGVALIWLISRIPSQDSANGPKKSQNPH